MNPATPLFCFCGASGSGKASLVETLCERYGLRKAKTITDRPKRYPAETGYRFLTPAEFDALPAGEILEQTLFSGHRYGSSKQELDSSDCVILDLRGICTIKSLYDRKAVSIGIHASMEDCAAHMRARGDSEDAIKIRLEHDAVAFGCMMDGCDFVVYNKDFETTLRRLWNIIQTESEGR